MSNKYLILSGEAVNGQFLKKYLTNNDISCISVDVNSKGNVDFQVPPISNSKLLATILDLAVKKNIDYIIPCSDHDLYFLSAHYETLSKSINNLGLIIPPKETILRFLDKKKAKDYAREFFSEFGEIGSKFFVRNRFSYKRPKYTKIITKSEIDNYSESEFVIDPFWDGIELSVDTFYPKGGACLISIRKRLNIQDGISRDAEFIDDLAFKKNIENFILSNHIYGFANIQFIKCGEYYKFIECNTRPGGGWQLSTKNNFLPKL
jgi:hypothetical protein